MIHCTIFLKDEEVSGLILKGHANAAKKGEDIICAGVSALVQNLYVGLSFIIDEDRMKADDGIFKVMLEQEEAQAVWLLTEAFRISIKMIQETYPGYIEVTEMDGD